MSSNLHLMLSSLTTLTTSATQFIRNPLGTITRVPAYFQLLLLRRCPLQLQPTLSGVVGALDLLLRKLFENYMRSGLDNQKEPTLKISIDDSSTVSFDVKMLT